VTAGNSRPWTRGCGVGSGSPDERDAGGFAIDPTDVRTSGRHLNVASSRATAAKEHLVRSQTAIPVSRAPRVLRWQA